MATPASGGAAQMFSPPSIPIAASGDFGVGEGELGQTGQGGRARRDLGCLAQKRGLHRVHPTRRPWVEGGRHRLGTTEA
eukprot:5209192-Pleurochrysis_carterae.AAC.3